MFCPQCGQQSTEGVRFCPRCGLSLASHAALLTGYNPAAVAASAEQQQPSPELSTRRRDMRRGAKLMFFSVFLFPVFLLLSIISDSPGPLFVPFMLFMAGLAWMLYARLFGEELLPLDRLSSRRDLSASAERPALGGPQFVPAQHFDQRRANTAEIVPPPSVTENTTKLLDKDV